jgi:FecR protein
MSDELRNLPLVKAPDSIWKAIEAELDAPAQNRPPRRFLPVMRWALAAAVVTALGVGLWYRTRPPKAGWDVVHADGSRGKIAVGEWLQTGAASTATLTVGGDIGTVQIEPNSRVRLLSARPGEQRLRLARGEISATVSAPPRLFFVDTPASTAVDLGCAYTMKADEDGNGLLRVTLGWVSLEWAGREALVPAGASCRTRPKLGPGTPYFDDASQGFQDALSRFDLASGDEGAIDRVLSEARVRDTLTLWHLLSRVAPGDRQRVYNRMVELVPLPKTVSPDKALQLDADALKIWREELAWKW